VWLAPHASPAAAQGIQLVRSAHDQQVRVGGLNEIGLQLKKRYVVPRVLMGPWIRVIPSRQRLSTSRSLQESVSQRHCERGQYRPASRMVDASGSLPMSQRGRRQAHHTDQDDVMFNTSCGVMSCLLPSLSCVVHTHKVVSLNHQLFFSSSCISILNSFLTLPLSCFKKTHPHFIEL
jgi:hypothetical protein